MHIPFNWIFVSVVLVEIAWLIAAAPSVPILVTNIIIKDKRFMSMNNMDGRV